MIDKDIAEWKIDINRQEIEISGWIKKINKKRKALDKFERKMMNKISLESWFIYDLFGTMEGSKELKNRFLEIKKGLKEAENCFKGGEKKWNLKKNIIDID